MYHLTQSMFPKFNSPRLWYKMLRLSQNNDHRLEYRCIHHVPVHFFVLLDQFLCLAYCLILLRQTALLQPTVLVQLVERLSTFQLVLSSISLLYLVSSYHPSHVTSHFLLCFLLIFALSHGGMCIMIMVSCLVFTGGVSPAQEECGSAVFPNSTGVFTHQCVVSFHTERQCEFATHGNCLSHLSFDIWSHHW